MPIPDHVSHADFMAAIKPLLDLCGVTADEILSEIHITPNEVTMQRISFLLVTDEAASPSQRPDLPEHSEYVVPITVTVGV